MPAVTVSSQISQAVYYASIIGLSLMLARPVYLVYSASQERSAQAVATGIASLVDSMSPGTTVLYSLQSYPGVGMSIVLQGSIVEASFGSSQASASAHWTLEHATLAGGSEYNFTLVGGSVRVAKDR